MAQPRRNGERNLEVPGAEPVNDGSRAIFGADLEEAFDGAKVVANLDAALVDGQLEGEAALEQLGVEILDVAEQSVIFSDCHGGHWRMSQCGL